MTGTLSPNSSKNSLASKDPAFTLCISTVRSGLDGLDSGTLCGGVLSALRSRSYCLKAEDCNGAEHENRCHASGKQFFSVLHRQHLANRICGGERFYPTTPRLELSSPCFLRDTRVSLSAIRNMCGNREPAFLSQQVSKRWREEISCRPKRVVTRRKVQVGQALGGEEEMLSTEMCCASANSSILWWLPITVQNG